MGWGLTSNRSRDSSSAVLMEMDAKVVDSEKCNSTYSKSRLPREVLPESMLCAGVYEDQAPCDGDEGGPLIMKGKSADK